MRLLVKWSYCYSHNDYGLKECRLIWMLLALESDDEIMDLSSVQNSLIYSRILRKLRVFLKKGLVFHSILIKIPNKFPFFLLIHAPYSTLAPLGSSSSSPFCHNRCYLWNDALQAQNQHKPFLGMSGIIFTQLLLYEATKVALWSTPDFAYLPKYHVLDMKNGIKMTLIVVLNAVLVLHSTFMAF